MDDVLHVIIDDVPICQPLWLVKTEVSACNIHVMPNSISLSLPLLLPPSNILKYSVQCLFINVPDRYHEHLSIRLPFSILRLDYVTAIGQYSSMLKRALNCVTKHSEHCVNCRKITYTLNNERPNFTYKHRGETYSYACGSMWFFKSVHCCDVAYLKKWSRACAITL